MDNQQLTLPGIINRKAENEIIRQCVQDGYINSTAMCKAAKKNSMNIVGQLIQKPLLKSFLPPSGFRLTDLFNLIKFCNKRP